MSVETHVDAALDRVETERAHVRNKKTAFERFGAAVRDIDPTGPAAGDAVADGGVMASALGSGRSGSGCQEVCEAFSELVGPVVAGDDERSTTAVLRAEFCDEVALALSPDSASGFTLQVKQAVLTATQNRTRELGALANALDVEHDSVASASAQLSGVTRWLASADETPLLELGFEALRERHERLSAFRDRCDQVADDRQDTLATTTSYRASAGISHEGVVGYLYEDLPTTHPVLTTAARLDEVCGDCQRVVWDHLTRRV